MLSPPYRSRKNQILRSASFAPGNLSEEGPGLVCDIPPAIHSGFERAENHSIDWVGCFGLVEANSEKFEKFIAARFARLAARAYPEVDIEALMLATDWITFAFFFDDMGDTRAAEDPAYSAQLLAREQRLIDLAKGARARPDDTPLERALDDILRRVARWAVPAWRSRFAQHVVEYIEGCRWERVLRLEGEIPSLSTYMRLRPLISAVYPSFDLSGIFIEGRNSSAVDGIFIRQLEGMATNHICWVNDIFGLDKELEEGTSSNLLVVLGHQNGVAPDATIAQAMAMCNAEWEAFEALALQLAPFGNRRTLDYVMALRSWMRGNLDWYGETSRYRRDMVGLAQTRCWAKD